MTRRAVVALVLLIAASGCTFRSLEGTGEDGSSGSSGKGSSGTSGTPGSSGAPGSFEANPGDPKAKAPPPVITSVAPLSGDYGTEVTVTGDNFDGATLALDTGGEPLTFEMPTSAGAESVVVTSWSKTEIKFKYPFPADGAIRVTSSGGQADGGTFVPSWVPGAAVSGNLSRRQLLGAVSPSAGTTVAAFDDGTSGLVVVAKTDGTTTTRAFDRGASTLTTMSLYLAPSGKVDGFFASGGTLWRLTDAEGAAATTDTGVAAQLAAGSEDGSGPYAWVRNGTTLQRLRAPAWSADLSATDPVPGTPPGVSLAVGTDHTLFVGWGEGASSGFPFYDQYANAVGARLRPGNGTFDAKVRVGGGADDIMVWTRFFLGPSARIASYFCANDTGIFSSPSLDCREGQNGGPTVSMTDVSSYVVGWSATTAAVAYCDMTTNTLSMGPETQTAEHVAALFPCPSVVAVSVDPAGKGHTLVRAGNAVYAPRERE